LKHPDVFSQIIREKHRVANHTFNHLNGWKTQDEEYISNIVKCEEILMHEIKKSGEELPGATGQKKLFRPPYGLIKKSQIRRIKEEYQIVMWDVLTGDFSKDLSEEKCLRKAINYSQPGSIVIFHDSIKAEKNLRYALPRFLDHFLSRQYQFEIL
jgi:peptidoglycan/xylan/chitin deacetylase (PgdA/CDA1 family)